MQTIKQSILTIIICLAVVAGVSVVSAWTGPTQAPPNGNTSEPINISGSSQYKTGAFGVGGIFHGYSNAIFDGSVQASSIQVYVPNVDSRSGLIIRNPNGFAAIYSNGALGNGLGFYVNSDENPANARMVINGVSGNVGIGTTNPDAKLDVNGYMRATTVAGTTVCIGSDCRTSWPTGEVNRFGGIYTVTYAGNCYAGNPLQNNECACPGGYSASAFAAGYICEGGSCPGTRGQSWQCTK